MRPYDGTSFGTRLFEVVDVTEFCEYTKVKKMTAIEDSRFTIGEDDFQFVVIPGYNISDSRFHNLHQRLDSERLLPIDSKLQIRH